MIYEIRHVSTYRYAATVPFARCTLRLLPRDDPGQRVFTSGLDVAPASTQRSRRTDFFGNHVTSLTVETPHRELKITARSRVEVDRAAPPLGALTPRWEQTRRDSVQTPSLAPNAPAHFMFPSRYTPLIDEITEYTRQSFAPGRPVLEGAAELMGRIRADFKYDPKATDISTPLREVFARRGGVCQDFAHLMIAGLRGLGLPAAYVSGYIRTIPPPGTKRLEGADASHAWVSVWCGAEFGWRDLDPTNNLHVGNDHIMLAVGRDYADVSPIDGVIVGSGDQKLTVSVDVLPINGPE